MVCIGDSFSVPFILSCLLSLLRAHPRGEWGTKVQAWYRKSFSSLRLNLFSFLPLVCKILLFFPPRVALKKEERTTARCLPFINSHKQGWRSDESTRLPPMWPGFKSRRWRHMWVEFVVGSLPCSERFFSGYSGFPSPKKPTFPNSNSTRNQVDEEPPSGCATCKSLFIYFYLFIYWFFSWSCIPLFGENWCSSALDFKELRRQTDFINSVDKAKIYASHPRGYYANFY